MNKKVDEEYKDIKDVYVLQCICSELKDRIEKYRHLFKTTKTEELMQKNEKLHSIINEARKYIEKNYDDYEEFIYGKEFKEKILEILDKENI